MNSLITFAMPYMNGPLHMGHLFTLMKAELASRYNEMTTGEKTLFPFAFHCTGMPIYASACKLRNGDLTVRKILAESGVKAKDISKFCDPEYWVKYFPEKALQTLSDPRLQLNIDFNRSFVTTSVNPYYDSFVKWQYNKLRDRMKFEGRYCIYSNKDKQPCADHDRQTGEGVVPMPYQVCLDGNIFCLKNEEKYIYPTGKLEHVTIKEYSGYMSAFWICNMRAQRFDITHTPGDLQYKEGAPITTTLQLYLPETEVISRSGDVCIVALTDQWYITYSDPVWKAQVLNCLHKMTIHDEEIRKQLVISATNMHDWCVSREYGLGTRIPWDDRFLIDSLSDSTVYMAYYTVCHLLHTDLYGKKQCGIRPEECTQDFWNQIFLENSISKGKWAQLITDCRAEFKKYYPVSLRVSGKDLIYNHLVMSIYHHLAIFGEAYTPKEYAVNGYVNIDGKKMSKSLGNFITVDDLMKKYDSNTIRVMLAEAGDGANDANIRLQLYNNTYKAVQALLDWHKKNQKEDIKIYSFRASSEVNSEIVASVVFFYQLLDALHKVKYAYSVGRFRDAITEGWRKTTKYYNTYLKENINMVDQHVDLYMLVQAYTMYPVLPTLYVNREAIEFIFNIPRDENIVKAREYCSEMETKISNKGSYNIKMHQKVVNSKSFSTIKSWLDSQCKYSITVDNTELHPSRDPFKVKPIIKEENL